MPQLLLEFFSEEIPARMQKRAEDDLVKLLTGKLEAAGLKPGAVKPFSSARHLGVVVEDLDAATADVSEEKKGPRVGAPEKAIEGFVKSAGLNSIEEAEIVSDKKGDFYVARIERKGRETKAVLAEIVPEIVRAFPWPKSMRSGVSDLTWVRPLHNILCLFDGAHIETHLDGVGCKAVTWGHRFHAPGEIKVKDAGEHYAKLRDAHVLIDRHERKAIILEQARKACAERGLDLVEDPGLLEEVTGLVEWPVALLGRMDPDFLSLPAEVIRLTMRTHQKYFAVRDPKSGKLAPHFVTIANISAKDGGDAIAAGNARVLSARLNDARYFWDVDRFYDPIEKTKPKKLDDEARIEKLKQIVFHQKLGSVWDKVERVSALAHELAPVVWKSASLPLEGGGGFETLEQFQDAIARAARLMKCDLVTEVVGEFPELQGQIGRELYLWELDLPPLPGGEGAGGEGHPGKSSASPTTSPPSQPSPTRGEGLSVAQAIEDHYRPLGPADRVPTDKVAIPLALADKLDTLVGFWAIDEKPTGSSDPYALRRAALGVVRILLNARLRLHLKSAVADAAMQNRRNRVTQAVVASNFAVSIRVIRDKFPAEQWAAVSQDKWNELLAAQGADSLSTNVSDNALDLIVQKMDRHDSGNGPHFIVSKSTQAWPIRAFTQGDDLLAFLADRLKVQLREQGKRHDLVDAVFALGDDDLVRIVARVEALDAFLKTEDGKNLLAGYKRAANILAAEEKKKAVSAEDSAAMEKGEIDQSLLEAAEEKALHAALVKATKEAEAAVAREDFAAAMTALAQLRQPVDAFFEGVLVNAENAMLRRNRMVLLALIRSALTRVADFAKIEG